MRELDRIFRDKRGVPVRIIRWEPENDRVIYLRDDYEHGECFSSLERFKQYFREVEVANEFTSEG